MPIDLINNPDFWALPVEERKKVMEEMYPDFAGMPEEEKNKALSEITDIKVGQLMQERQAQMPITEADFAGPVSPTVAPQTGRTAAEMAGAPTMAPGEYGLAVGDVVAEAAPYVGGAAGGALGAPVGGLPGSMAGASLGGMTGEAYRQWWKSIRGDEEAPTDLWEIQERMGRAGLEQAAYDLAGGAVAKVASKTASPIIEKTTRELAKRLKKIKGPHFTVGEATESRLIQAIEETTSVVGAETSKVKRADVLKKYAEEIAEAQGDNPIMAGTLLLDTVKGNKSAWMKIANDEYDEIGRLVGEKFQIKVDTTPLKRAVDDMREPMEQLGGDLGEGLEELIRRVDKYAPEINFEYAKILRTKLLSQRRALEPVVGKKAPIMNTLRKLEKALDNQMETELALASMERIEYAQGMAKAGKETFPNSTAAEIAELRKGYKRIIESHSGDKALHKRWRRVSNNYKENAEIFDAELIQKLVRKGDPEFGGSPELVVGIIADKSRTTNVRRLKNALLKPKVGVRPIEAGKPVTHLAKKEAVVTKEAQETWEVFQASVLDSILKKSKNADEVLIGSRMRRNMYTGTNALGKDFIEEVFKKDLYGNPTGKLKQLELVMDGLEKIQTKRLGQNIGIGLRLVTYGGPAGYAIYQDPTDPRNIAIAMSPWMASRVMLRSRPGAAVVKGGVNFTQELLRIGKSKDVNAGLVRLGKLMYDVAKEEDEVRRK